MDTMAVWSVIADFTTRDVGASACRVFAEELTCTSLCLLTSDRTGATGFPLPI
jgi:hypothetical protein